MHRAAPAQYVTIPVTRGAITRVVTSTGTVNPVLTIIVGTYVSGVIQNLFCDYNTQVRAGQVCAKIDPRPYQATLDQYSGQLLRDEAVLSKDRTDLLRYQQLVAQNSIARQQAEDQAYVVNQDEGTVKLDRALV
jgi:HlyD family secretion protein